MSNIEDIANDPEWQPAEKEPVATSTRHISTFFGREEDVTEVVRELNIGLLYAVAVDEKGMPVLRNGSYPVDDFPKGDSSYQLINMTTVRNKGIPGFSSTFEYKAGKTPDGLDDARIEYTTWYNPTHGLVILTEVQARQAIEGGWLDICINSATNDIDDRGLRTTIVSANESMDLDRYGNLEKPRLVHTYRELEHIHRAIGNGSGVDNLRTVDPLRTAKALIEGFPTQRPLHMEELIRYNPDHLQPRMT